METNTFDYIWRLLAPQGEYKRREQACRLLWAGYDEQKQCAIYRTIQAKQQRGEYVSPNPYFAIEDTALSMAAKPLARRQPTNYNGRNLDPKVHYVRAVYNGTGGLYTFDEAREFNMQILGDFNP